MEDEDKDETKLTNKINRIRDSRGNPIDPSPLLLYEIMRRLHA